MGPIEKEGNNLHPISRRRYTLEEAAEQLAISIRQLRYRMDEEEIDVVWEGDKPLITHQEIERYAAEDHASVPPEAKTKKPKKKKPPPQP
jgi:hypothetical protein